MTNAPYTAVSLGASLCRDQTRMPGIAPQEALPPVDQITRVSVLDPYFYS